ncbi:MAG: replication restart helicase PriA [Candidatus Ratteibacteria bacterium]
MKLVEVVFDIPIEKKFLYLCEDEIFNFVRVYAPLGRKKRHGFIISIYDEINKNEEYKLVEKIYDTTPLINNEIFNLCKIISKRYYLSLGQTIFSIIGNFPLNYEKIKAKETPDELFLTSTSFKKEIHLFENEKERLNFYFDLIEKTNGSIILLFPEIEILEKFFRKIKRVFKKKILKYYGEMNKKERFENYLRSIYEKNLLIIGTRVSVFLPLSDLSLIIVDSYTENSYREKKYPKLNAIDVAEIRCFERGIPFILTDYTFSVNDYPEIKNKKTLIFDRRNFENLPEIMIFNKKWDQMNKNINFLTNFSLSLTEETVLSGRKVGIIHNRKGSWKTYKCENCGHVLRCKKCNSILVFFKKNKIICKYCKIPEEIKKCPDCGSKKIIERIIGIEKIYKTLKEYYPDFKIQKFTAEEKKLEKDTDIFVGTQIIAKILDKFDFGLIIFPHVDSFLNIPEYNSEEIFFLTINEFIWKLKEKNAKIIIQTKNPDFKIFTSLKTKNYEIFYESEIKARKLVDYPPFSDIILIEIPFKKSSVFENRVNLLKKIIEKSRLEIIFSDLVIKRNKRKLKIILKSKNDKRLNYEEIMEIREKLDFKIEINPSVF